MGGVAVRSSARLLAACLFAGAASAAPDGSAEAEHHLAVGVRLGLMPPVLAVVEALARPVPHLALGVFGMAVPDKSSIGGELMVETASRGASTPYIQVAYLSYQDRGPLQERSKAAYLTAGYIWKSARGETQLGAGVFYILSEHLAPCTGFFCSGSGLFGPPVLPTLDLAFRFGLF